MTGMQGRIVAATGATSGIGAEAVEALARAGARIVFIARDANRAGATLQKLQQIAPGLGHAYYIADLSLMREVRRVGAEIAAAEPRIDVLVNNAGALFARREATDEGLERTFALNHMSYFALTSALLGSLKAAPSARIVSTASRAHQGFRLDFAHLQAENGYSAFGAYGRSKLANILFTRELARRLKGSNVTANCLHPGFVASRFADEAGGLVAVFAGFAKRFAISTQQGADTLVYLASSPEVEGVSGGYFAKRRPVTPSPAARDEAAARLLWDVSEGLLAKA